MTYTKIMAIPKKYKQNKKARGIYSSEILLLAQENWDKFRQGKPNNHQSGVLGKSVKTCGFLLPMAILLTSLKGTNMSGKRRQKKGWDSWGIMILRHWEYGERRSRYIMIWLCGFLVEMTNTESQSVTTQ